jgi:hypothetical protein
MRFLVMLAGFAAVLGVATPAQADPGNSGPDASFLAALNKAGITYQDPTVAVAVGKKACELMDQGNPEVGVIKSVSSSNPGFTADGAAQFTMIAASAYCPQHMGQPITQAPPTPLPPQQSPIIDFPIITPPAGRHSRQPTLGEVAAATIGNNGAWRCAG